MQEKIRCLAYEIYLKNGCCDGRALEHWLEAERMVLQRPAALSAPRKSRSKKADAERTVAEAPGKKTSGARKTAAPQVKRVAAEAKGTGKATERKSTAAVKEQQRKAIK